MLTTLDNDQKQVFTPTDLRKEFGVTARALRFYQVKGLLNPERDGLARNYDRRDRARLALILRCKRFGLTLQEIRKLLDLYDVDKGITQRRASLEMLEAQSQHLQSQIAEMTQGLEELRETCEEIRQIQRENGEIESGLEHRSHAAKG
ncbi:MAG: MerR family transcriptional regulator [Rhizobiales bacterium]|nr:MerR family transcriptional regulator [Hyphomicrobiales bacterium]